VQCERRGTADPSLETWQRELRRRFGREQAFVLTKTVEVPVFSDSQVTNPSRATLQGEHPRRPAWLLIRCELSIIKPTVFDLKQSQEAAKARLRVASRRRRRSDRGRSRLPAVVLAEVRTSALGVGRPSMSGLQKRVAAVCRASRLRTPSRASLYNAFATIEGHSYEIASLPPPVLEVLYNLAPTGSVPGPQLAFYCFNYGSLTEVSYAAGLPWLDLYQARRLRGWRPRSRGLLDAVMRVRGI
jgi:hypothetical protein